MRKGPAPKRRNATSPPTRPAQPDSHSSPATKAARSIMAKLDEQRAEIARLATVVRAALA